MCVSDVLLRQRRCALCLQGSAATAQQAARGARHHGADSDPGARLKVGAGPPASRDDGLTAGPDLLATHILSYQSLVIKAEMTSAIHILYFQNRREVEWTE